MWTLSLDKSLRTSGKVCIRTGGGVCANASGSVVAILKAWTTHEVRLHLYKVLYKDLELAPVFVHICGHSVAPKK